MDIETGTLKVFLEAVAPEIVLHPYAERFCELIERGVQATKLRVADDVPEDFSKDEAALYSMLWWLIHEPNARHYYCTYSQSVADLHKYWCIDFAKKLGIKTEERSGSIAFPGGGMIRFGSCFGATMGYHVTGLALIDDFVAYQDDAERHRTKAADWFSSSLLTRLSPKKSVVICLADFGGWDTCLGIEKFKP